MARNQGRERERALVFPNPAREIASLDEYLPRAIAEAEGNGPQNEATAERLRRLADQIDHPLLQAWIGGNLEVTKTNLGVYGEWTSIVDHSCE